MKIKFGIETVEGIAIEGAELFAKHHFEVGYLEERPMPDFSGYFQAEENGALRLFTARNDGVLVGYAIFWVRKCTHYSYIEAVQDMLFIHPKHRGFGVRFIKWIDGQLSKMKVKRVYHNLPLNRNFGPFMERLGYKPLQMTYVKKL